MTVVQVIGIIMIVNGIGAAGLVVHGTGRGAHVEHGVLVMVIVMNVADHGIVLNHVKELVLIAQVRHKGDVYKQDQASVMPIAAEHPESCKITAGMLPLVVMALVMVQKIALLAPATVALAAAMGLVTMEKTVLPVPVTVALAAAMELVIMGRTVAAAPVTAEPVVLLTVTLPTAARETAAAVIAAQAVTSGQPVMPLPIPGPIPVVQPKPVPAPSPAMCLTPIPPVVPGLRIT